MPVELHQHQADTTRNGRRERLSAAIWEALDRPVLDVAENVFTVVPDATIAEIADEYMATIKIGLPSDPVRGLEVLMPRLRRPLVAMEIWRQIGLIAGAIS